MTFFSNVRVLALISCSHYIHAATPVLTNNLDSLLTNDKLKFVFVGGKGGVGKTTSSSAIASQLSLSISEATKSNKRILLISTDPAHSLSDAFRMKFSNVPTPIMPTLPNLEVMEVDPGETMKRELSLWSDLAKELGYDPDSGDENAEAGIGSKIHSFQEWLSGIPGIDEATALSSAIEHIESGRYDMIVFDTAPTGHTLKLLELPKILQVGIEKLEGWQATLWGYWEMIQNLGSGSGASSGIKEKVATKLKDYKASIGRVANMITDVERTRFVVVCIAEYLSISESRRLLGELDRFKVVASHIVVNQLVTDYMEPHELERLEEWVKEMKETDGTQLERSIIEKAFKSAQLTTARRNIQSKYLKDLKNSPEVKRLPDPEAPEKTNRQASTEPLTVLEVPLLPSEVTGPKAILEFSHYLIGKELESENSKAVGVEGERSKKARASEAQASAEQEKETVTKKQSDSKAAGKAGGKEKLKAQADGIMNELMKDPELKKMLEDSPKLQKIAEEVKNDPMAGLKYMGDPDVAPFLQKAMSRLMGGGGRAGKGKKKKGGADGLGDIGDMLGNLDLGGLANQLNPEL